ncbi:MAG: hypothetical protein B7C24_04225 [Bacteroidetes bacterium 4572_77]|nr:MAG: hypothetical protein B7C24_04225 [Bacteroidetes bacterium 4572_77]
MNNSIYNLIKENRKLFYLGVLKNSYKTTEETIEPIKAAPIKTIATAKHGQIRLFKDRSINLLQEIFNE